MFSDRLLLIPLVAILTGAVLVGSGLYGASNDTGASALSTNDFDAGRIIDDTVFYNKSSMSAQQIQDFLNSLVPNCDTWGTAPSLYGGGTRAEYAASQGWHGPPYVCINNYHENPNTGETSFEKGGYGFAGGTSAAQIIYDASQQYGINPQVLLVMLKKESAGPLTADPWPLKSQYTYAMGYGCPDSGPNYSANCNAEQAGFYRQVMKAAWQLKYYKDHQNDYRYKIGLNEIQYSPDPTCGTKTVHIENVATLSLYIYTPYTPNHLALANYPGEAPCGAYGNRNFFMFFKEWFGSPNYRAPVCDSKVADVKCVWRLYDPDRGTDFLTVNNSERDTAVLSSKYSYSEIAFYAFSSQKPGTIPIYRIRLPDRHFFTSSTSEKDALVQNPANVYEGIAFYAFPPSVSTNASHPVSRLYGPRGNLLVTDKTSINTLVSTGYVVEGDAFNTPSGFITPPNASSNRTNVYRVNDGKKHLFTVGLAEVDQLVRKNWKYEGIMLEAPLSQTSTPIYRLFNKAHLFTSSMKERDELINAGWKYEGIGWYADNSTPYTYRFYLNSSHFYTASMKEALSITNRGAKYEGVAFGKNQGSSIPVHRLYDGSKHFFTANVNEILSIANSGWKYEGVAWQSTTAGSPVYRLKGPYHFYTSSNAEKDILANSGWKYEGVAWQSTTAGSPVYRLKGPYHFYTSSNAEKDVLVNSGWKYEGVAW